MTNYLLGQGKIYVAKRDSLGNPGAQRWLGDVSAAKASFKVNKVSQKESFSGQRATVKTVIVGREASIDLTLQEINKENLSLVLHGQNQSIQSGTISGEALPVGLLVGDRVSLKYPKVSSVVLTDSAGVPQVIDPAKYKVDADFGGITILDVAGFTQPIKAAYTHAALDNVSIFSNTPSEIFIRYEGINLAQDSAPIVLEFYKVNTDPLKDLSLITDKFADLNLSCDVLIDTQKPADPEIGQFGRVIQIKQN